MDYAAHNREVKETWDAFFAGDPIRMPVIADVSDRYFVLSRETNPRGVSFREYTQSPRLMFEMQADFWKWHRLNVPGDHEMGMPETGWNANIDFQNYYEAGWLGCEVKFPDGEVPYAVPMLDDDRKNLLLDRGIPGAFDGLMGRMREYYEKFTEYKKDFLLDGLPVTGIGVPAMGTDGPFTLGCELRGAANFCADIYEDPEYFHQMMDYLTEAIIKRLTGWREYLGEPLRPASFWFADDSVQLLSLPCYKEFVLPYHKRLKEALSTGEKPGGVHLCGDVQRLLPTIRDELNVGSFDTGFPIDHEKLVRELGPDVIIQGGVLASAVLSGPAEEIIAQSRAIIEKVKPLTKKFVFRDANNLPPQTPLQNMWTMYDCAREAGRYR